MKSLLGIPSPVGWVTDLCRRFRGLVPSIIGDLGAQRQRVPSTETCRFLMQALLTTPPTIKIHTSSCFVYKSVILGFRNLGTSISGALGFCLGNSMCVSIPYANPVLYVGRFVFSASVNGDLAADEWFTIFNLVLLTLNLCGFFVCCYFVLEILVILRT